MRWQKITIDQLGGVCNLILTFSVASLGYLFSLLKGTTFSSNYSRVWWIVSFLFISAAAILGLLTTVNRLKDFRCTAQRARSHGKNPEKAYVDKLGERTWILFRWQVAMFAIGVVSIGIDSLSLFGSKLVPK